MITKIYHLGKIKLQDLYCIGIQRSGNGTLPLSFTTANGVRNEVTMRMANSFDSLAGYLTSVVGEFSFEGESGSNFFQVSFRHWDQKSEEIFHDYLTRIPLENRFPLSIDESRTLESRIIGLKIGYL